MGHYFLDTQYEHYQISLKLPPTWQRPGWGFHRGREYPWVDRLGVVGGVRGIVRDAARRVAHAAQLRIAEFSSCVSRIYDVLQF